MIRFTNAVWTAGRFSLELDLGLNARVTGIFGASGSGKTTLLELIAGLKHPRNGEITLAGETLCSRGLWLPPEYRKIGYVPQDAALFPHLSVGENLRYGLKSRATAVQRFREGPISDLLALSGLLETPVAGLSGGERQRVALARALLSQPQLLLLDEPLASVDLGRRETVLPYLQRVRDETGLPMVYVSHSAEELVPLCDEIVILEAGRVVDRGAPQKVFMEQQITTYRRRA